jgi:protein subunit release factor A
MKDNELLSLIDAERKPNIEKLRECEESIVRQMVPKDEDDDKGVVLEVRSGTG